MNTDATNADATNADATVDLRSDTLTHPTERMRQAMHAAEVGDDTFGDDPTVKRLEAMAAERLGKEAAVYVPSGSMGNSTALITYLEIGSRSGAGRPALAVHETHAHMFSSDRDRFARALFPVESAAVDTEWGVLGPEHLQQAVAAHPEAEPLLLCIENTHNYTGGGAVTPAQVNAVAGAAHAAGMRVHCDGARLFNAAVAQRLPAAELVEQVDSVMFCVSKGLSAPVGSILCGEAAFIDAARDTRKIHGGSMRQAGVIAAAGIVSLEAMVDRLAEDHVNAARLRAGLRTIEGIEVVEPPIPTNFAVVDVRGLGWTADEMLDRYRAEGVLGGSRPPTRIRLVVNRHIGPPQVDRVIEATRHIVASGSEAGAATVAGTAR
ncbi:MAG: beta-eliminating lyase-related protein [Spirochaetaceae bacterium]|nr:beta-eliminating lyase-related protein [Spirochaetaceae bacterium]